MTQERPILFSAEMVRAILDGRKTATRRVVKPQPADDIAPAKFPSGEIAWKSSLRHAHGNTTAHFCPYGKPGDLLWVRETWAAIRCWEDGHIETPKSIPKDLGAWNVAFAADEHPEHVEDRGWSWKPSIHMPRWASRITLEVTGIRVERVRDISEEDAHAEGFDGSEYTAVTWFRNLWDSINAKRGYGWDANPWCWVVTFRRETTA